MLTNIISKNMKRFILIVVTLLVGVAYCSAQEATKQDGDDTVRVGDSAVVTSNNGKLSLSFNGTAFEIGKRESVVSGNQAYADMASAINDEPLNNDQRAYFGFMGVGSPYYNHFALLEFGVTTLVGTDFSAYSPSEANAMKHAFNKGFNFTANLGTVNISLNKSRSLALSMAFGVMVDRFKFSDGHTLEYREGMMHPVQHGEGYTKSKLEASYFHLPVTLDWNISRTVFVSAGVNLDVLMGTALVYKKPRTTVEGTVTLNPVQVGVTARVGWKRLYGYMNYSFVDMFKHDTGPDGKRLSAGVGIWF